MDKDIIVERCNHIIGNLSSMLMSVMYTKNTIYSIIRLIFLKYVTDNCFKADTNEKMMQYVRVQKMFAARDNENGQAAVYPILKMLDEEYHLNDILTSALNEYAKDLFGTDDSWGRKNSTLEHYKEIMAGVAELNLEETTDDMLLGRTLVECLCKMVDVRARNIMSVAETITPDGVAQLAKNILHVNKEEVYADFAAGAGLSTLEIVDDHDTKIITSDKNAECAAVAAMLYIMAGYEDFYIAIENSLTKYDETYAVADKMFIDMPFNVKNSIDGKKINSTYLAIEKTINMLKENGVAVLVVSGNILFGMTKAQIDQRKKLIENKWLKAVISLPACLYHTGVGINLMVISKTNVEKVLFVNASTNANYPFTEKERKNNVLTNQGIEKLVQIIENGEEINSISKYCTIDQIAENSYDLTPAKYIAEEKIDATTSLEEIENELAVLYKKLGL